ncbi:MAG: tripartite tricarboxylate transporter TctB family protein, partial [Hydrogenophaga sp.]|nr:tripartite tricarboxylate transporter TctB family protein [Hydrogenophaga sp.]
MTWASGSRAVGVLLMALAAGAAWLALDLPFVHRGTVGPGAFPGLLAAAMGAAGLVLALRRPAPQEPMPGLSGAWALLGGMLLFPLSFPWLGTLPALALCGTVIARTTSRSWARACLIGPG